MTGAIAATGHSPSLLAQLSSIEAEIAKLDDRLTEMNQPRDLALSLEDLRAVLHDRAAEIGSLLRGDVEGARQALDKYVDRLVLTPKRSWMVPFSMYRATLKFSIDTMLRMGYVAVVVARDGIEPPTPAFSGPPSNLLSGLESS